MLKEQSATPEQIATRPHPFYTPIATFDSKYTLQPVAFGLKFAGAFCGATLLQADISSKLQASGVNATAYAAKLANGRTSVSILNKDADKDLALAIDFGTDKSGELEIDTLHAQALDSREAHITRSAQRGHLKQGIYEVIVPAGDRHATHSCLNQCILCCSRLMKTRNR